jgi:D-arabinose 1-dehydrogenase-like Zn-dependent alcohol dehydrogenase
VIAAGHLAPVVSTFPLDQVVEQFHALEKGQVKGRIAFIP